MKALGIIGGIGPESTVDYYRSLVSKYREHTKDGSYPAIIINSIDMQKMLGFVSANEFAGLAEYLAFEVRRVHAAGASFALLAANTPHIAFEEIQRQSPIPLISIVEVTREAAKALKLTRVGLFGTRFTIEGGFYQAAFSKDGMEIITPDPDEQTFIHQKYFSELVQGIFLPETRTQLLEIVDRLIARNNIQGLILAGTELPLILRDTTHEGIPLLNTTQVHVVAAVEKLLRMP